MARCLDGVVRYIHQIAREPDSRSDCQLLEQFLHDNDEPAFAVLLRRHGPMVLGVCRRILHDPHDVDDAFQATFLVLLRKARSTVWRSQLGPWLYGVAFRTAQKARFLRSRNRARERQDDVTMLEPTPVESNQPDWLAWLDEEILALPEKYRLPLLLCEIQGHTRRDAARRLCLAEGTLSSRLARARVMLRGRLVRRGIVLTAAGLLEGLTNRATACVAPELQTATAHIAAVSSSGLVAGTIPAAVITLAEGIVKGMLISKFKLLGILLVALGSLCLTGNWVVNQASAYDGQQTAEANVNSPQESKTLTPIEKPAVQAPETVAEMIWRRLGVELVPVAADAVKPNNSLKGGMQVTRLDKGGCAAKASIERNDVLVGIAAWETLTLDNVAFVLGRLDSQGQNRSPFLVVRDGKPRAGELELIHPEKISLPPAALATNLIPIQHLIAMRLSEIDAKGKATLLAAPVLATLDMQVASIQMGTPTKPGEILSNQERPSFSFEATVLLKDLADGKVRMELTARNESVEDLDKESYTSLGSTARLVRILERNQPVKLIIAKQADGSALRWVDLVIVSTSRAQGMDPESVRKLLPALPKVDDSDLP